MCFQADPSQSLAHCTAVRERKPTEAVNVPIRRSTGKAEGRGEGTERGCRSTKAGGAHSNLPRLLMGQWMDDC